MWFCVVVVLLMWPFPACVSLQANCSTNRPNNTAATTAAAATPAGPSTRSRKPGAVIESFVNHAPGVFSGTFSGEETLGFLIAAQGERTPCTLHNEIQLKASFYENRHVLNRRRKRKICSGFAVPSMDFKRFFFFAKIVINFNPYLSATFFSLGTLHPNCQDSNGRPRRDISTILQILNDLLSATRHYQGIPPSLTQLRYQTQCGPPASSSPSPPPSPPVAAVPVLSAKATSVPSGSASSSPPTLHPLMQCQSQIRMCKPPGKWP